MSILGMMNWKNMSFVVTLQKNLKQRKSLFVDAVSIDIPWMCTASTATFSGISTPASRIRIVAIRKGFGVAHSELWIY